MAGLGSIPVGLGSVPTAGQAGDGGGGGGGGILDVTSPDGSITVTNPAGPHVQVEVNPAASRSTLFDLFLSYGHGMAVDANLPALASFWFSPTTIADLAIAGQVREWVTEEALGFLELVVRVDAAHLVTGGGAFVLTVNGLDTALSLSLGAGDTADTTLATSALLPVSAGSKLGVRWNGSAAADGSTLRAEIRLQAAATGTPIIPSTLPINPLALFRPEDLATDGTSWVDSVAGHLYTLTVPPSTPAPGYHPIAGPNRILDGSFNNNPYAQFLPYTGPGPAVYTPNQLRTLTGMFSGTGGTPISPRTIVAVCRPTSSIGGLLASTQLSGNAFNAVLYKPTGDPTQSAYYNFTKGLPTNINMSTPVNLAGQEVVLIWRTDGTTLEFFIDGILQTLAASLVGDDGFVATGFSLGGSGNYTSQIGWQGDICFEGVWARRFTDAEVLSATGNLAAEYVT